MMPVTRAPTRTPRRGQSDGIYRLFGIGFYLGFGMKGNAKSGYREHRKIVCSISHGNGLCDIYIFYLCDELQ